MALGCGPMTAFLLRLALRVHYLDGHHFHLGVVVRHSLDSAKIRGMTGDMRCAQAQLKDKNSDEHTGWS